MHPQHAADRTCSGPVAFFPQIHANPSACGKPKRSPPPALLDPPGGPRPFRHCNSELLVSRQDSLRPPPAFPEPGLRAQRWAVLRSAREEQTSLRAGSITRGFAENPESARFGPDQAFALALRVWRAAYLRPESRAGRRADAPAPQAWHQGEHQILLPGKPGLQRPGEDLARRRGCRLSATIAAPVRCRPDYRGEPVSLWERGNV